jgi:hypothetical protein
MKYLSICSIIKDETSYIEEFIAFNKTIGVEKFYFYDNESRVPVKETAARHIDSGLVKVIDFPGAGKQMVAYSDFISNFGSETEWAAIIDLDEYLVPQIGKNLPSILSNYEKDHIASLQVSWRIFGNNGHLEKPDGLIIENYTSASPKNWSENTHTKAVIRPAKTLRAGSNPHYCVPKPGCFNVGEKFNEVRNAWSPHSSEVLQLNHYFTKSLEEFKDKIQRPRADVSDPNIEKRKLEDFYSFNGHCTEVDSSALRFVPRVKQILNFPLMKDDP